MGLGFGAHHHRILQALPSNSESRDIQKAQIAARSSRLSEVLGGNLTTDEMIKTTTYAERRRLQYQIVLHLFNRQVFREFRFEERYIIIVLLCFCSLTAISTYVQRITAGISYDNIYFL